MLDGCLVKDGCWMAVWCRMDGVVDTCFPPEPVLGWDEVGDGKHLRTDSSPNNKEDRQAGRQAECWALREGRTCRDSAMPGQT